MSAWRRRLIGWLIGGDFLLVSRHTTDGWLVNATMSRESWQLLPLEQIRETAVAVLEITEPR